MTELRGRESAAGAIPQAEQNEPDEQEAKKERLAEGVRQIVSTRERTPRSPRWDAAWKRTLFRFNERLRRLRQGG